MKKTEMKTLMMAFTVFFAVAVVFSGCRSKKDTPDYSAMGTELEIPCSDNEFYSDNTHFRGTGIGESTNLASARRQASLDANAALATSINSTIKSVTERYTQDVTIGDAMEFNQNFEDMTRQVVNQTLNNVSTVCNRTFENEGRYSVYLAVEVDKDELLNDINSRISRDDRLRLDYDRMKFEEIFNEEMENLRDERP